MNATSAWRRSERCSSSGGCPSGSLQRLSRAGVRAGSSRCRKLAKAALVAGRLSFSWRSWRLSNFPTRSGKSCRSSRNCCRLPCRTSPRPKRRIGSTRTGRPRTGTGSTMQVRAPRPFRCPTTGLSRWNSRAFTCSPDPACSRTAIISNGSASCQARKPSIPTRRPCVASAIRTRPTPRPSRRRRPSRA